MHLIIQFSSMKLTNHLDSHPAFLSTPTAFLVAPCRRNSQSKFGLSIPTTCTKLLPTVSITCTPWFHRARASVTLSSGVEAMLACIAMLVSGPEITQARGTFGGLLFRRSCRLASMVLALLDLMPVGLSRWVARSTAVPSCLFDGMLVRSCCRGSEITTSKRTGNGFRYHNSIHMNTTGGGSHFLTQILVSTGAIRVSKACCRWQYTPGSDMAL